MLHLFLYGVLAVALAGGLFAVAARFLPAGEQIAPSVRDEPPWELPEDQAMTPDDIDAVRLPVALRGYRFAETDLLLDRLAGELRARDAEIARLRGDVEAPAPPPFFGPVRPPVARPGEGTDEQMAEMLAVDEALEDPEPDGAPSTESVHSAGAGDWTAQAPPWAVGPAPLASAPPAGPPLASAPLASAPLAGPPLAGPPPLASPPSPAVDTQAEAGPEVMDGPAHRRQRRRGRK